MDTNQKTPVQERKRSPQTGTQKRPASQTSQRKPASAQKKAAAASTPVKKQSAAATAARKAAPAPQGQRKQTAAPAKKRTVAAKPAYDASETLTSGKRRTSAKKSSFQLPWKTSGEKKSLSRSEQTRLRQEKRAEEAQKKQRREQKHPAPAVVYTQPAAFNSTRLLIQLLTVTAVVVALVLGLSVFFKVGTITVSGADVYSAWAIREASGINEGDNLLTFSRAKANAQIQAKLPYVEKSRIGIKLPDTVTIYIEELQVAYAIAAEDGIWWLMNSDGRLVEQVDSGTAKKHTQVLGVTITGPVVNEYAVATEEIPSETNALGELIPITVSGAQRLNAALDILSALEDNDIVGDAATVDVTSMSAIELWYGSRYQVNLGDSSNMDYKVASMYDVILQLSNYQTGKLDCSFTTFQNDVGYTPFD